MCVAIRLNYFIIVLILLLLKCLLKIEKWYIVFDYIIIRRV